jgi:hypothetical protein
MTEECKGGAEARSSFSSGNPVFDGLVTILASKPFMVTDAGIRTLHKTLQELAESEPGGLRRSIATRDSIRQPKQQRLTGEEIAQRRAR